MKESMGLQPNKPRPFLRVFDFKITGYSHSLLSSKQALRTPALSLPECRAEPWVTVQGLYRVHNAWPNTLECFISMQGREEKTELVCPHYISPQSPTNSTLRCAPPWLAPLPHHAQRVNAKTGRNTKPKVLSNPT